MHSFAPGIAERACLPRLLVGLVCLGQLIACWIAINIVNATDCTIETLYTVTELSDGQLLQITKPF